MARTTTNTQNKPLLSNTRHHFVKVNVHFRCIQISEIDFYPFSFFPFQPDTMEEEKEKGNMAAGSEVLAVAVMAEVMVAEVMEAVMEAVASEEDGERKATYM